MNEIEVFMRVVDVMNATFRVLPSYEVTRETTSADIDGWDSLSHALFMMAIEREFDLELPLERMYDLANIGDLVDLIIHCANANGQAS